MEISIKKVNSLYGIGVIFLILGVGVWADIKPLPLTSKVSPAELPALFATLILVSAFLERAIEVFLSSMRSAGADELDNRVQHLEKQMKNVEAATTEDEEGNSKSIEKELELARSLRIQYRGRSRQISQWIGLILGTLIAMIGIRLLGSLVVYTETMGAAGQMLFIIVDILITGAVLAGGSDAINKMTKLYSTFMEASNRKAQS